MLPTLFALVATLGVTVSDSPGDDARKDAERLQGKWIATAIQQRGRALTQDEVKITMLTLVVRGNRFEFYTASRSRQGSFHLNPTADPRAIDFRRDRAGQEKEAALLGIYELRGDVLRLAVDEGMRPTRFESVGRDGPLVAEFRRARR